MPRLVTLEDPGLQDQVYLEPRIDGDFEWPSALDAPMAASGIPSVQPMAHSVLRGRLVPDAVPSGRAERRARRDAEEGSESWPLPALLSVLALGYLVVNAGMVGSLLGVVEVDPGHGMWSQLRQATVWSFVAALALVMWRHGIALKPSPTTLLALVAGVAGLFQLSLLVAAGLWFGFGRSPYGFAPPLLAANLLYAGSVLAAVELTRACTVTLIARRNPTAALLVGAGVFALVQLPLARVMSLGDGTVFEFAGADLLPLTAAGLVASVFILEGGPVPALIYGGIVQAFMWMSPILPNLPWAAAAFVGTVGPVLVLTVTLPITAADADEEPRSAGGTGRIIAALGTVVVFWIISGFFGVKPIVVSGPSMEPALYVGDIVVVREVEPTEIAVGDIVVFALDSVDVIHRVVDISGDSKDVEWILTRGDANNRPDDPVPASAIRGKVVVSIPKIGWPSILLRRLVSGF